MQRRLFFRSLIGAGPAVAAVAKPAPAARVLARAEIPTCRCGQVYMVKAAWMLEGAEREALLATKHDGPGIWADPQVAALEYMVCTNKRCADFLKPFALPTFELAPADPRVVAAVAESERLAREAKERAWREEEDLRKAALRQHELWESRVSSEWNPRPKILKSIPAGFRAYNEKTGAEMRVGDVYESMFLSML